MNAPTITAFHVQTDKDRGLYYSVDPDLTAKLMQSGIAMSAGEATHVLVTLDVDGEPYDSVDMDMPRGGQPDVETLDRAIAVLTAAREGLLS